MGGSTILTLALLPALLAAADPGPMIVNKPDGTVTIQKQPANGNAKDQAAKKGLVIPPQVVVPIVPNRQR